MSKKTLGLKVNVNSIGWALIEETESEKSIIKTGVRRIPLTTDDYNEYITGKNISKNANRTNQRNARTSIDRFKQRRENLTTELKKLGMLPSEDLIKLDQIKLWELRANAAQKGHQISLEELGRILYHLNQKRGYKSSKSDESEDKSAKDYVAQINERYETIKKLNMTIGQYILSKMKETAHTSEKGKISYNYRTKLQVYPRKAYEAEYDQIMSVQREFYKDKLTDEIIDKIKNNIIYYQRKLRSCKNLVAIDEFQKVYRPDENGNLKETGPKVCPITSPLNQVCKIWESINNIKLQNKNNEVLEITLEQKKQMFDFMDNNEKMTLKNLYDILNITKEDGWWAGKAIGKGLQGNITKIELAKALGEDSLKEKLLKFELEEIETDKIDEETGLTITEITRNFEKQPLYQLWHTVYSINDKEEFKNALEKKFGITDENIVNKLFAIDFVKKGYANKSSKTIRKILPALQMGLMYSDACEYAGFKHYENITIINSKKHKDKLELIKKNQLKQPIIEKILNQVINIVNAITEKYGTIDEIAVELASEVKASKDERNSIARNKYNRENENKEIRNIIEELKIEPTRNKILKYRLWEEAEHKCFYCDEEIDIKKFLEEKTSEIDHIIPKSLLFDESTSNKICSCKNCNKLKDNKTAYDFMQEKGEKVMEDYLYKIDKMFKDGKISKTKRDRLTTPIDKIPTNLIEKDMGISKYLMKKTIQILKQVTDNVIGTSRNMTEFLEKTWFYADIIHDINFEDYKKAKFTENVTYERNGKKITTERIKYWNNNSDIRTSIVDAITIAQTSKDIIQTFKLLKDQREKMHEELKNMDDKKFNYNSLLQKWTEAQNHINKESVIKNIENTIVSYKAGKRVTSLSKNIKYKKGKKIIEQSRVLTPRGPLSEQSVYGKIKIINKDVEAKDLIYKVNNIVNQEIKEIVMERIKEYKGDLKEAQKSIRKNPLQKTDIEYRNGIKYTITKNIEKASCYEEACVIKYALESLKIEDTDYIVDKKVREKVKERFETYKGNMKNIFDEPIYLDEAKTNQIRTVRCFTGLTSVVPLKYDSNNKVLGYVKSGNNHSATLYSDKDGNLIEYITTFWDAVERKKFGLPVIITNPKETLIKAKKLNLPKQYIETLPKEEWNYLNSIQQNEMFILGLDEELYRKAIKEKDYKLLTKNLYRVQKLSKNCYTFRHQKETTVDDKYNGIKNQKLSSILGKFINITGPKSFVQKNPHKVKISIIGELEEA